MRRKRDRIAAGDAGFGEHLERPARNVVGRGRAALVGIDTLEAGAVRAVGDVDGVEAALHAHRQAEGRPGSAGRGSSMSNMTFLKNPNMFGFA